MNQLTKKSILIIFSILTVWSVTMTGCKKDEDDKTNTDNSPGFSYKVDGVEFKSGVNSSGYDTTFFGTDSLTEIALASQDTSSVLDLIISARIAGSYSINENSGNTGIYAVTVNKNDLIYFATNGSITVTKFDLVAKKVSGTFSFDAEELSFEPPKKIIKITEGKFTDIPFVDFPE